MRPPVDVGVHRAPRCEPVVSLVRSRRAHLSPDRSSKILLVQVGTLSSSHPSFGVSVFFLLSFSLYWPPYTPAAAPSEPTVCVSPAFLRSMLSALFASAATLSRRSVLAGSGAIVLPHLAQAAEADGARRRY